MEINKYIPEIEGRIGYTFRDKSLLRQAFTRASFCNEANRFEKIGYQSNEVLEFFGDSVLSAVIVTSLIKTKTERYATVLKQISARAIFRISAQSLRIKEIYRRI